MSESTTKKRDHRRDTKPGSKGHKVAVVVQNGAIASDFAIPLDVLSKARLSDNTPCYEVKLCGVTRSVRSEHFQLSSAASLSQLATADTIIVAGIADPLATVPAALIKALRAACKRGKRIASICTGAFVLAAAGILDGKRATTHWLAADELANRYPQIDVDPNVLYVDNGQVLTSAGAVAALDLCLHLIQQDFGPTVAAQSSRKSVMPLARPGGQAQFIQQQPVPRAYGSLQELLIWVENNLQMKLDVPQMADQAAMSVRSLHRRFIEQTGMTPNAWVLQARVRAAQHLLEASGLSVEQIAQQSGFGSAANFRARFKMLVGTSPAMYRLAFRGEDKLAE